MTDALVDRPLASIGDPVFQDTAGLANPPGPRESWIDLQAEVVAVASAAPERGVALAQALLRAVLHQRPSVRATCWRPNLSLSCCRPSRTTCA